MTQPNGHQSEVPVFLKGWRLVGITASALVLMSAAMVWGATLTVENVRLVIRATARTSFILFMLAFTASALYSRWPSAFTRWQRQNRRYLGVSFAISHALHAIAIVMFARLDPQHFHQAVNMTTYVFGGSAYLFIIAMTVTSFDRTAAWIGPRAWRMLHTAGSYLIWLIFFFSESKRAVHDPFYYPFVAIAIMALGIRLFSYSRQANLQTAAAQK